MNENRKRTRSLGRLRAQKKTKPNSPDCIGPIRIHRHTLEELIRQLTDSGGDEVTANLAGWQNSDPNGEYLTVELSPRKVPRPADSKPAGLFAMFNQVEA